MTRPLSRPHPNLPVPGHCFRIGSGLKYLESTKIKTAVSGVTTFTFTVDGVTLSGWVYDPSTNVETSDWVTYYK